MQMGVRCRYIHILCLFLFLLSFFFLSIFFSFFFLVSRRNHQPFPRSLDCHAKFDFPRRCPSKPYHFCLHAPPSDPGLSPHHILTVTLLFFCSLEGILLKIHVGKRILSPSFSFIFAVDRQCFSISRRSCPRQPFFYFL